MQAIIVFCVCIGSPVQEKGSPSAVEAPSAAKLVTEARRQTDWIYKIKTLRMQTRHKTIRSPAKVQEVRNRFRRSNQSEFVDIEAAIAERPFLQAEESSFQTITWTREKYFHQWKTGWTEKSVSKTIPVPFTTCCSTVYQVYSTVRLYVFSK